MCVRPMVVKENIVPCGKCYQCKRQDRNNWSMRVYDEIKKGTFITLTYSDEYLPKDGKLVKKHLQDYIKRLREQIRKIAYGYNVKYFAVGEHGGKFGRSHYHIIININDIDSIKKAWKFGFVYVGKVTGASIHYCTKYLQKQIGEKKKDKERREFRLMSKGLGKLYLKRYGDYHKENLLLYRIVHGKKYTLPRYYKDRIFDKENKEYQLEVEKNVLKRLEQLKELYKGKLKGQVKKEQEEKYKKMITRFDTLEQLQQIKLLTIKNLKK